MNTHSFNLFPEILKIYGMSTIYIHFVCVYIHIEGSIFSLKRSKRIEDKMKKRQIPKNLNLLPNWFEHW